MKEPGSQIIGQLAVESPQFIPVFERYGLDYYQKGDRTLQEACLAAGLELSQIHQELQVQGPLPVNDKVDERSTLSEIVHTIVNRHHTYVREQLREIEGLLDGLGWGEGEVSHAAILKKIFLRLDGSLRQHLLEEETDVFPRILWIERRGAGSDETEEERSFLSAIHHVLLDHRVMDREFAELKKLVFHFKALSPTSVKLADFSKALDALDQDNHRHIHLENNVLLRKAVALGIMRRS
jgi:regulator of cell morphogenesis and NO signaling